MKTILKIIIILILISLLAVSTGCGGSGKTGQSDSGTEGKQTIKVGYFPNVTHAQALVGFSDGTFAKALGEGVNIEEHIFNAGPAEIEALLAGEIDLGYIGPGPAVNGYVKSNGALKIVSGTSNAGAILISRKGVNIRTVKDLDGKKVAIPQLGNTQDLTLRSLLARENLKDAAKGGTVTVIPAENPDILTLIANGDVDAAFVPEPWGSRIVKQAGAEVVLDSGEVWPDGEYTTAVVIVSTKFLEEHPDLVEKWLDAHVSLTEKINSNITGSQDIINNQIEKLTKKALSKDILESSFERIKVTYNPETESVKQFVRLSVDNGYLKDEPDISSLFDLDILNKILEKKGLPAVK